MSDNAEEGIARTQATAARQRGGADAIQQQQKRGTKYLGQRIVTFFAAISFLVLVGVWGDDGFAPVALWLAPLSPSAW